MRSGETGTAANMYAETPKGTPLRRPRPSPAPAHPELLGGHPDSAGSPVTQQSQVLLSDIFSSY